MQNVRSISNTEQHVEYTRARASSEVAGLVILATAHEISGRVRKDTYSKTPTRRKTGV